DSGGPLYDLNGRLIGIHSRVGTNLQVNNNVPMTEYIEHCDQMLAGEFIGEGPFAKKPEKGKGFLGVSSEAHPSGGLKVTRVGTDTAAAEAGLVAGDVIRSLNEQAVDSKEALKEILKELAPGDEIRLEIERKGKSETLTFELGER
ncbi:MAG: S1C family serine protease, partial [Luteolibacter sp.]